MELQQELEGRIRPLEDIEGSDVPILHSFVVLRGEYFGGYIFNPYLPPETSLDRTRFQVASLCDGAHTISDIKDRLLEVLDHSDAYIDGIVRETVHSFDEKLMLSWRADRASEPRPFGSLEPPDLLETGARYLSAPTSVIWEVTNACNLRCGHCFAGSGANQEEELDTDEAKNLLDLFDERKVFTVSFGGGEPLVRPDIFELLEHASRKNLAIELLTNGSLVSDEVVRRLEDTSICHVQVSLDGLEETHDHLRGVEGSFNRAVRAVRLLQEAGFGVNVATTINKLNIDEIPALIDLVADVGVKIIRTNIFVPYGRGRGMQTLALTTQDIKRLTFMVNTKRREDAARIMINSRELYPWLTREPSSRAEEQQYEDSTLQCAAGNSIMYVTSEGDAAPCSFMRHMTFGNLTRMDFGEMWHGADILRTLRNIHSSDLKGECRDCSLLGGECVGGCRAVALARTGDMFNSDPMCWKHLA